MKKKKALKVLKKIRKDLCREMEEMQPLDDRMPVIRKISALDRAIRIMKRCTP